MGYMEPLSCYIGLFGMVCVNVTTYAGKQFMVSYAARSTAIGLLHARLYRENFRTDLQRPHQSDS